MSDLQDEYEINIRAAHYFIAQSTARCARCGQSTRVLALALSEQHETLEDDVGADADANAVTHASTYLWQPASRGALLFYVSYLPESVRTRLRSLSLSYRDAGSGEPPDGYWSNYCDHCGFLLSDQELFCEPDGAFLPTSQREADRIGLLRIDEHFESAAEGYALDPQFLGRALVA